MSDKPAGAAGEPERLSLRRWSQRKLDAARGKDEPAKPAAPAEAAAAPPAPVASPNVAPPAAPAPLPPIASLTIDSEYGPFFKPHVDEATRRAALKQLFRDPRFNIMDGLDSLVGDFSKSDPIPPEMLKELLHARHVFNPPPTRVNEQGHVVDVVEEVAPQPATAADASAATAAGVAPVAAPPASAPAAADRSSTTGDGEKS